MITSRAQAISYFDLDARQSHDVFMQVLTQLCDGHYYDNGALWVTHDMEGRGSDVIERVTKSTYTEGRYEMLVLYCKLRKKLQRRCYNFEEHRYHKGKCVECGREEDK